MAAENVRPGSRIEQPEVVRLRLLEAMDHALSTAETLHVALQHATAELGGLGGLVHWRDAVSGEVRLVAANGLAPEIAEAWANLREDEDVAPAQAMRSGGFVWVAEDSMGIGASGTAAVPLLGIGGRSGALSVFKAGPGKPDAAQRSFLCSVAAWAAGHLEGNGTSPRMAGTLWGPAHTHAARDAGVGALRAMSDGFLAVAEDWRITFVNEEAERLLGPGRTLLGSVLWDVPAVRVSGLEGQCRRAIAGGKPIGFDLHWPPDQRLYQARLVPVPGRGLTIYFVDVTDERLQEAERTAERVAAERTVRMGELTAALAEALTSKDVVQVVAERVLPPVGADGLVVQVLEDDRVYAIGAVGYSQEFLSAIYELPLSSEVVLLDVLGNRAPRFVESTAEFIRIYPMMENLTSTSTKNAWAFLPLIASGHAIGCCTVSFTQPRSFGDEERTLLTALSGLVAQALERARLYDREHIRAQELQRGLLPRTLPSLPAVSAAARYLPAGTGEEVGGDWYDLIPLSADRVAMVIGDVMGHGITEAATMGQLRTAVRTLADLEMAPDEVLSHLNDLVSDRGDDCYATCLYAVFDPVTRICSFSLAGHPPPVVVHPDGTLHCPEPDADPPLGAAEPPFATHELHLPEESLLVFCTDGLVESTTRGIDQGLVQLRQTLGQAVARTSYFSAGDGDGGAGLLDDLCDVIISALLPDRERINDDAALLIAHTRGTAATDIASCSLPEDPTAAGQAREYIRKQLAAWGLDDLVITTELLVSELVGNVIRHAKGPIRLRLMRSGSLICEVYDGSLTTPRIRRATHTDEGGRGMQLVAALSQRWGTRFLDDGKCIWTEQDLPLAC